MTKVFAAVILIVIGFITIIQGQCYVDEVTGESVCAVYTQWKSDGGKDDISWASDCAIDIEGNDLKTVPNVSDYAKCGELCFQDEKCTHYTFTKAAGGRCAMKAKVRDAGQQPKKSPGAYCGYINTRTDFAWVGK